MADMPQTAPAVKPVNPNFSSGPCAKRPGWTVEALSKALVSPGQAKKLEVDGKPMSYGVIAQNEQSPRP